MLREDVTNGGAPQFIYFDIDDTLLDHRAAERAALADLHAAGRFGDHPLAHVQATYHTSNVPLWRDFAAGRITKNELQHERFARLLTALSLPQADPAATGTDYLDRYGAHWRWTEGAEAAFHAIADAFPVGLLTNGFREQQRAKLDRFPALASRAETVIISEEVGAMKPHLDIFRHATEAAGVAAGEILYVGDSLHSDVEGGTAFGWRVAWLTDSAQEAPEGAVAVRSWREVLRHLGL